MVIDLSVPPPLLALSTTPLRIPRAFDWSALPAGLSAAEMLGMLDALLALGPFGFRGPAAPDVPEHFTTLDGGVRTVTVVAAGYPAQAAEFFEDEEWLRVATDDGATVLAFHRLAGPRRLVLERPGSLPAAAVRAAIEPYGFDLG